MAYAAGQKLRASDLNIPTVSATDATSRDTTSTSFTGTLTPAGLCGVSFTAPPSGKVILHHSVELKNTAANFTACAPAVRTGAVVGSGAAVLGALFDNAVRCDQAAFIRAGVATDLSGLTPGTVYNVSLEQIVGAGTGTFVRRRVVVSPVLA